MAGFDTSSSATTVLTCYMMILFLTTQHIHHILLNGNYSQSKSRFRHMGFHNEPRMIL